MENLNYYVCPTIDKPIIYCLRGKNGDLLIDTGRTFSVHHADHWIRKNGFDIRYLLLTHGHFDHSWNAKFFQKKYHTKIILHQADLPLYRGEKTPLLCPSSPQNANITRFSNRILQRVHNPVTYIDFPIADTDTGLLHELGFDAQIVLLPGHTAGSIGVKTESVLYCGDACSVVNGVYQTAFFGEDPSKLLETEQYLLSMKPKILCPGHGQVVYMDPDSANVQKRKV